jgi:hypothetical protein
MPQHAVEPLFVAERDTALHVLLPLRGQDRRERPKCDDDVDAVGAEVFDDGPDARRGRLGQPLAADHHPLVGCGSSLIDEVPPLPQPMTVAGLRGDAPDGLGRFDRVTPRAGVPDAMLSQGGTGQVKRELERRRAGLVGTHVEEDGSLRQAGSIGAGRHRTRWCLAGGGRGHGRQA